MSVPGGMNAQAAIWATLFDQLLLCHQPTQLEWVGRYLGT